MASYKKRGRSYQVRWRDPDGRERSRRAPDYESARELARAVEGAVALGRRWTPPDADEVPLLLAIGKNEAGEDEVVGGLISDFLEARHGRYAPNTHDLYDRALKRFVQFLAQRHPSRRQLTVDLLTVDAAEAWLGELLADPKVSRSYARVQMGALRAAWMWAWDRSTVYGRHVARPRSIEVPRPHGAPARAPTWAEMDAVIAALHQLADRSRQATAHWRARARLATLLRFTGLRVNEQALRLTWDDVDLERGELVVRGELGKSQAEQAGRIVPVSSHLVEIMSGWGVREGWLIPWGPHRRSRAGALDEAWKAAGVSERVWGVGPGRRKAQQQHAFRKGFKTGLSKLGVERDVRDFLLGHHRGIDAVYIEMSEQARDAVALIPPLAEVESNNVTRLDAATEQG